MQKYPKVGDFSTHPINEKLANLGVRSTASQVGKTARSGC